MCQHAEGLRGEGTSYSPSWHSPSAIGPLANLDPIVAEMCTSSARWSWASWPKAEEMLQWPESCDSLRNQHWPVCLMLFGGLTNDLRLWCEARRGWRHPGDMAEGEVVGDLPVGGQWRERERDKEEGVGRSSCIVFQIWGSLQRTLPRSPGLFASLPLKCNL